MAKKKATKKKASKKKASKKKASKKKASKKKASKKKKVKKKATKKKKAKKKTVKKKPTKKKATKKKKVKKKAKKKKATKKKVKKKAAKKKAAKKKTPKKITSAVSLDPFGHPESTVGAPLQLPKDLVHRRAGLINRRYKEQIKSLSPLIKEVSVGMCYVAGKPTGEIGIRIHCESQAAKEELKSLVFGGEIDLRRYYEGIRIDIVVWKFHLIGSKYEGDRIRSCHKNTIGTLGANLLITRDNVDEVLWLTAAHVVVGLDPNAPLPDPNDSITIKDGNSNSVAIGNTRKRYFLRDEFVDAALLQPNDDLTDEVESFIFPRPVFENDVGEEVNYWAVRDANPKQQFKGYIDSVDRDAVYPIGDSEEAKDHFLVGGIETLGGDSGAVVFMGNEAIGVVRAASDPDPESGQILTICSRIEAVIDYFTIANSASGLLLANIKT